MVDLIHDYYAYWAIVLLLAVGMYGMIVKKNLMKKLIGMIIFQNAVILFFVTMAFKWNATVPILDPSRPVTEPENYLNPLPHTLMLTAIVVGVALTGAAFAMLIVIYRNYGTLDEPVLLERMEAE